MSGPGLPMQGGAPPPGGPMPGGPMPGGPPGGPPPGLPPGGLAQGAMAQQGQQIQKLIMQCATMVAGLVSEIRKIPGVDPQKLQQAVQMLKQGTVLLAEALPGQGKGPPPPMGGGDMGGPPDMGGAPPGPPMGALGAGGP